MCKTCKFFDVITGSNELCPDPNSGCNYTSSFWTITETVSLIKSQLWLIAVAPSTSKGPVNPVNLDLQLQHNVLYFVCLETGKLFCGIRFVIWSRLANIL